MTSSAVVGLVERGLEDGFVLQAAGGVDEDLAVGAAAQPAQVARVRNLSEVERELSSAAMSSNIIVSTLATAPPRGCPGRRVRRVIHRSTRTAPDGWRVCHPRGHG